MKVPRYAAIQREPSESCGWLVQHYRGEGDASWDDVAANFGGAGLVALGALA